MQDWKKGALIALAGVVILSFDSLLVRLIDASAWDLLFWRGDLYAFVAAQAGLILLLEILLGPMFVYLALGEQPSSNDIQGGLLILLTLVGHTLWEAFQGAKEGVTEDI